MTSATDQYEKMTLAFKEQMEKMTQTFKLPNVDVADLLEKQRKTMEAVSQTAHASSEAAAEVSQRQLDILRATSEHLASMFKDMKLSADQQRELATKSFEAAIASTRELAEKTAKSNAEVFDLVKQRLTDNLESLQKTWKV